VVYDLAGRVVRRLMDEVVPAGRQEASWDGKDDRGRQVSSGVYLVRLVATGQSESRKVTLVK
jgi:serine protease